MDAFIYSYSRIVNGRAEINGNPVMESPATGDPAAFLGALYKQLNLRYPKFFKMDNLCKLGLLAAELVIQNTPDFTAGQETALVFSNAASSMDSDRQHLAAISNKAQYFPSPAIFVYTLPNIVLGEIAIKHKITGENAFFVSQAFAPELAFDYAGILLQNHRASTVLCGWVNTDGRACEAFVYCVKKGTFNGPSSGFWRPHSPDSIRQLYQS